MRNIFKLYFWSINTSHTQMKQFINQKQHFPSVLTLYNFDVLECYVKTHEQCFHLILPFSSKKVGAIKRIKDLNIGQNDRANNYKAWARQTRCQHPHQYSGAWLPLISHYNNVCYSQKQISKLTLSIHLDRFFKPKIKSYRIKPSESKWIELITKFFPDRLLIIKYVLWIIRQKIGYFRTFVSSFAKTPWDN